MSETEQKACPLYSSEFYTVDFNAHGRLTIKCDGVVIAEQSGHTQADAFLAAYELVHSGVASLRASIAEKAEQLAAAHREIERLRGFLDRLPDKIRHSGEPGPGGINITNGVPSEIYVAIGRDRYESEYEVAEATAEGVRTGIADSIPRWLAAALAAPAEEGKNDDV